MKHYWISVYRPQGYDPASMEDAAMIEEIDALNAEMVAAGVRVFVGGLVPPQQAHHLGNDANGNLSFLPGTYLDAREYVDGFWVLACQDLDSALEWGRKAAAACRASIEVRPFNE
jgi:hypothetical protein